MRGARPWTVQPPAGTPIDWDSPLAQGLAFASYGSMGVNLAGGGAAQITGTSLKVVTGSNASAPFGPARGFNGEGVGTTDSVLTSYTADFDQYSTLVQFLGTANSASKALLDKESSGDRNNDNLYADTVSGSAYTAFWYARAFGSNVYFWDLPYSSITINAPHLMVLVFDGSSATAALTQYLDGAPMGTASQSVSGTILQNTAPLYVGNRFDSYRVWDGYIAHVTRWGRLLSETEALALSRNPWQVYWKRRRAYSIASGGGGAISGTTAVTLDASGTLTGAGALAGTSAIAFTATATPYSAGALTGTTALTFAAAGTLAGAGALAGTSAITFTASGALKAAGALAGTETLTFGTNATLAGAGALSATAALTFTASATPYTAGAISGTATVIFTASGTLKSTGNMPNVVGQNFYEALEILQDAGIYQPLVAFAFAPSSITVKWAKSAYRPGVVAAQSIAAGTQAAAGAPLTLTVSQYPFGSVIDMPADWKQIN